MRILVADDELHNRTLMSNLLSPYGRTDLVVDGQEAVEAFEMAMDEEDPYTLVCLDIMMPDKDGQQALVEIRDHEKKHGITSNNECTILMVSALDSEDQVVQAFFRGGCTDYITKPVTIAKIREKLEEHNLITPA